MSRDEWIPPRPHCLPGCDRLDGHDGRDDGACMGPGGVILRRPKRGCWGFEIGSRGSAVCNLIWLAVLLGAVAYFIVGVA